jgi:glycosyltransferase involved in cell wall biosynthesis
MAQQDGLPLVMIGNWDNSEYGRELREKYADVAHIHLLDPIYEQHILNQIRSNCTVYLHGHSAGGTNPSLVEAMYLGLAIFAYDVSYNKETTEHQAAYFHDAEDLAKLVNDMSKEILNDNAAKMYEIASRRYVWKEIAQEYAKLF